MQLRSAIVILSATLAFASASVEAASPDVAPHHHAMSKAASPSTRGYESAMESMHKNMHAPVSGNADIDFVRQMIPHHQGAVDMAKVELRYGKDKQVKRFARWVIRAQEQEIAAMQNWLERKDSGAHPAGANDLYVDAMMRMHQAMMIDYTGDADVDFVRGMIPHHQGALDMASIWFTYGADPDIKVLADDIYGSQSGEIAMMKRWLDNHCK